jgi:hypothetical protein
MKPAIAATLVLLSAASAANAASETLLCVADMSTGFAMEGKEWVTARFTVKDLRFVVKPVTPYEYLGKEVNYEVTKMGESYPSHRCNRGDGAEQMSCGGLGWGFTVNFRTLRYQDYYGIGYVDGRDNGDNTPSVTIGKCVQL